jgi:uncharacterized membrane protein YqjE
VIDAPPEPPGFVGALRELADGILEGVQDRIALLAVELQEEKVRLISTLVWVGTAFFAGMMALIFSSLALVYIFWESARLAVLGGLGAAYTIALIAIVIHLRRRLARHPRPFGAVLEELSRDRACIRQND